MKSADIKNVKITGGYWGKRTEINRKVTLATEYEQLKLTGRLDTFKQLWTGGKSDKPHYFGDSDIAKWIEACSYSLVNFPDAETEALIDLIINDIENAQWEDGYLNSYFSVTDKTQRWTNLLIMHELYCAGHLMEAAVAYYNATGKDKLLNIMCKCADHIDSVFGPEKGKLHGYPGHEEIELALVKLYRVTDVERYLNLAKYFVNERGRQPSYYDMELQKNPNLLRYNRNKGTTKPYAYVQAHEPITDQHTIEGHSVRALYFLAGVADIAGETGDTSLLDSCSRLYMNMVNKRMYITGGIGSTPDIERFSFDYDLPNETAYAETCAAIASVFFCHRMLNITSDGKYADTMELALYNGIMSGVSLDGTGFFYANPLAVEVKAVDEETLEFKSQMGYKRRKWFGCACCPTNIARLLSSLGEYFYSIKDDSIFINLYGTSEFTCGELTIIQTTDYPWMETVNIRISCNRTVEKTIALRIPSWCRNYKISINDVVETIKSLSGYAYISRRWKDGDEIELYMEMPVEKMQAHPNVRHNTGKIALQRGPVIYCLEEEDNGKNLSAVCISPTDSFTPVYDKDFLEGCTYLTGPAYRLSDSDFSNVLYKIYTSKYVKTTIKAIPYAMWTNRTPGDMLIWINCLTS